MEIKMINVKGGGEITAINAYGEVDGTHVGESSFLRVRQQIDRKPYVWYEQNDNGDLIELSPIISHLLEQEYQNRYGTRRKTR